MTAHPFARSGPLYCVVLVVGLLVSLLGATGTAGAAKPDHPSQDLPRIPQRCSVGYPYINPDVRPCTINRFKARRPTIVLWGDSHALQMMPALRRAVAGRRVNLVMFSLGSCPPLRFDRPRRSKRVACKGFNADALDYVTDLHRRGKPVRVVLGGHWQAYRWLHRGIFKTKTLDRSDYPGYVVEVARIFPRRAPALLRRLGRLGVDVDVIGQAATVPTKIRTCGRGENPYVCNIKRHRALPQERATRAWLGRVMRPLGRDARLIDPNRAFCNRRICRGRKNGIYTFFNDLHISATRSRTLEKFFLPTVWRVKRRR